MSDGVAVLLETKFHYSLHDFPGKWQHICQIAIKDQSRLEKSANEAFSLPSRECNFSERVF